MEEVEPWDDDDDDCDDDMLTIRMEEVEPWYDDDDDDDDVDDNEGEDGRHWEGLHDDATTTCDDDDNDGYDDEDDNEGDDEPYQSPHTSPNPNVRQRAPTESIPKEPPPLGQHVCRGGRPPCCPHHNIRVQGCVRRRRS